VGFTVTDTVRNQGNSSARSFSVKYYLSTDAVKSGNDIPLVGTRVVGPLGPRGASTGTATVSVANGTRGGTYFLIACADELLVVPESNETNNCLTAATTVQVGAADLVVTAVSVPPASARVGSSFTMTATVTNQGTAAAGASNLEYYLSADAMKSASDITLTGTRLVGTLNPGQSSTGATALTIPTTTAPGTYFVIVCADVGLVVAESNNGNNCLTAATSLTVSP